jgi:hypothetical protein
MPYPYILLLGVLTSFKPPFQPTDDEKTRKIRKIMSGFDILAAILARRRRPVASVIALDPLRWSMRLVTYPCRRTNRASKTAKKYGTFSSFFLAFDPTIRPRQYSNTVQILAQWRRPVASHEALNTLYWLISAVLCRRIISSIKTARTEVRSFVVDDSKIDLNVAY